MTKHDHVVARFNGADLTFRIARADLDTLESLGTPAFTLFRTITAGPEAAVPLPDGRSIPVKFLQPPGPVANQNQGGGGALTVHVSLDSDLLRAEVVNTAGQVVARATPSIVRLANDNAPGAVVDKQMRFGG